MKTVTKRKFVGSWGVIVLWVILCWPIAIIYYFMRSETETINVK